MSVGDGDRAEPRRVPRKVLLVTHPVDFGNMAYERGRNQSYEYPTDR
jgi:hypothetical protein